MGNRSFQLKSYFYCFSFQKLEKSGPDPHPDLAQYLTSNNTEKWSVSVPTKHSFLLKRIQLRNVSEVTSGSYMCVVTSPKPTFVTYTTR
jgi:hypothetical protein